MYHVSKKAQVHPTEVEGGGATIPAYHGRDPGTSGSGGDDNTGMWHIILLKTGVQSTKERLKSLWTTLGVVSALLTALTYPYVVSPAVGSKHSTDGREADHPLVQAYTLITTFSFLASLVVVIVTVIFTIDIDFCTTDEDTAQFINKFQLLFLMVLTLFCLSVIGILISMIVIAWYNYSQRVAIAISALSAVMTTLTAINGALVGTHTRAKLAIHAKQLRTQMGGHS